MQSKGRNVSMRRSLKSLSLPLLVSLVLLNAGRSQTPPAAAPNFTKQPTLYVVPYAHLDTQWRWEYPQTINEYIRNTMRDNFLLFEKYPHYIFNFSGANRYRMMKEYHPSDYAKVKQYVAAGRWFPSSSSMEENDVNSPSAESVIRQVLYGKQYFRREFGKTSAEYMLPDCFGFPASSDLKRTTSIRPPPNRSSGRCSTASSISAASSARPARNTCCRTVSGSPPRCPAFWPMPDSKGFRHRSCRGVLEREPAARGRRRVLQPASRSMWDFGRDLTQTAWLPRAEAR